MVERVQQARASIAIAKATPASHFWAQQQDREGLHHHRAKGPLKACRPHTADEYQQYTNCQTRLNGEALGSMRGRDPSPARRRVDQASASMAMAMSHEPSSDSYNPPLVRRMRSPSPQLHGSCRGSNVYTTTNAIETMLENGRRARRPGPSRRPEAMTGAGYDHMHARSRTRTHKAVAPCDHTHTSARAHTHTHTCTRRAALRT